MTKEFFKIFTDGGARGNPGKAAIGFVVFNEEGKEIKRGKKFIGQATNNIAEYQAVIEAMKFLKIDLFASPVQQAKKKTEIKVDFFLDSLLVVNQLKGLYRIKNKNLATLVIEIRSLEKDLALIFNYHFVPREKNKIADQLVNQALDSEMMI